MYWKSGMKWIEIKLDETQINEWDEMKLNEDKWDVTRIINVLKIRNEMKIGNEMKWK